MQWFPVEVENLDSSRIPALMSIERCDGKERARKKPRVFPMLGLLEPDGRQWRAKRPEPGVGIE